MKITIDTENKTIEVAEDFNYEEMTKLMDKINWKEYKIKAIKHLTVTTINVPAPTPNFIPYLQPTGLPKYPDWFPRITC